MVFPALRNAEQVREKHIRELQDRTAGLEFYVSEGLADRTGKQAAYTAIQRVIDKAEDAGGGIVVGPPGTYLLDTGLTIAHPAVSFRGHGKGTILKPTTAITCVTLNPPAGNFSQNVVSGLQIDLNNVSGANGILIAAAGQRAIVRDVLIDNLNGGYGVKTGLHSAVNNVRLDLVRVRADGDQAGNAFVLGCDAVTMIDCEFAGGTTGHEGTGYGIVIYATVSSINIIGGEIAHCAQAVRVWDDTGGTGVIVYALNIIGLRVEGMTDQTMYIYGYDTTTNRARGVNILGGYFSTCTKGIYLRRVIGFNISGCVFKDVAPADTGAIELFSPTTYGTIGPCSILGTTPALIKVGTNQEGIVQLQDGLGGCVLTDSAHAGAYQISTSGGNVFVTANTEAATLNGLTNGLVGKRVTVIIADAFTIVDFTGTTLKGNAGADWSPASGDFMTCVYNGTNWYCDVVDATA